MGKSKKDAVGGHRVKDPFYDLDGWKRLSKDRANRMLRRQAKHIQAQALLEYDNDNYANLLEQRKLDDADASYYAQMHYLEYEREMDEHQRELELDLQLDDEYDEIVQRMHESFIYERDIDSHKYDDDYRYDDHWKELERDYL